MKTFAKLLLACVCFSAMVAEAQMGRGPGGNPGRGPGAPAPHPGNPGPGHPGNPGPGPGNPNPGPGHPGNPGHGGPRREYVTTFHFRDRKTAEAYRKCTADRSMRFECRAANHECTPCTVESHTDHSQYDLYRLR